MLNFMKWFLLTQVIAVTIEAKPAKEHGLTFEDCGSLYDIVRIDISSCTYSPCFMPQRKRVRIKAEFEFMGYPMNHTMRHEVIWILNSVHTKAYTKPDACERSCLYRTPTGYGFNADVFVSSRLPSVRGTMKWVSFNSQGAKVVCLRLPVVLGVQ